MFLFTVILGVNSSSQNIWKVCLYHWIIFYYEWRLNFFFQMEFQTDLDLMIAWSKSFTYGIYNVLDKIFLFSFYQKSKFK